MHAGEGAPEISGTIRQHCCSRIPEWRNRARERRGAVELGQQDYSTISRLNGKPTAIIAIYQLPGSNALQTAEGVRKLMAGMKDRLPEDVDYAISLDKPCRSAKA